jgi:hypothetical protein
MIQQLTYNNGKKILVGLAEKAGSSSAISMMGYPLLGEFKYRKERLPLISKGIWTEKNYTQVNNWQDYDVRIAIVRDPVERFVSCYKDRVFNKNKDGTRNYVKSFDYFLENIDSISHQSRDIRKHSLPLVDIIGPVSKYNYIIPLSKLNTEFISMIEEISGVQGIPISYNKTSKKAGEVVLTSKQVSEIKMRYREDYKNYGEWFKS